MTLFVYPATTTHLSQRAAVRHSNTHTNTHTRTHTCISLCAHLLNSSFQVSFSDMLFVVCSRCCRCSFPQLCSCLLPHSPVACVPFLFRTHTHTHTHTKVDTATSPTAYFIIVHTRRTRPICPLESAPSCATYCAPWWVFFCCVPVLQCLAIYLPRLAGKLINNFVKFCTAAEAAVTASA